MHTRLCNSTSQKYSNLNSGILVGCACMQAPKHHKADGDTTKRLLCRHTEVYRLVVFPFLETGLFSARSRSLKMCAVREGLLLGMGNPLLDISAHVKDDMLEKCVLEPFVIVSF